ncbi:unnamed protein product [Rhizopus stolonifer]
MDHSNHNMGNMSMTGNNKKMGHMMMGAMGTFHWGTAGDGLWINTWVPNSKGSYTGALFGILFMAILSRGIPVLEISFMSWKKSQATKASNDHLNEIAQNTKPDIEASSNFVSYNSLLRLPTIPAFSWKSEFIRSILSAFSTFISYLLMMAVMTGNGGYFFILVAGVFIGELFFGRYKQLPRAYNEHEH